MTEEAHFRVTFVRPNGWQYVTTGRASNEREAVKLANDLLEYVVRIGIADFLTADGLTVEPPARLTVERVAPSETASGLGLVITDPQGNVTRK